jgi:hypothetical protein
VSNKPWFRKGGQEQNGCTFSRIMVFKTKGFVISKRLLAFLKAKYFTKPSYPNKALWVVSMLAKVCLVNAKYDFLHDSLKCSCLQLFPFHYWISVFFLLEERDCRWIRWLYWATMGTLYRARGPLRTAAPGALAPKASPMGWAERSHRRRPNSP